MDELGKTSDDVANTLFLLGVRGVRRSSDNCPIINYFYRKNPNAWPGLEAPKPGKLTYNDSQILDPTVSPAVMDFMRKFDDGCYPKLEAK